MELQYNGLENSRIYLSGDFSRDVEAAQCVNLSVTTTA